METVRIQGGTPLHGSVRIQGSKNAALPILAATLAVGERCELPGCPRITDVERMAELLQSLGCRVVRTADGWSVDTAPLNYCRMPSEAVTGMRSSLCLLGALLGRCGEVTMEHPGGCVIGSRPIDLHLDALGRMGAVFEERNGLLRASAAQLHGAELTLTFPSVGATENIILAAVQAEGATHVAGAAREPEITALCEFLNACGAGITGVGTTRLTIPGRSGAAVLHGAEYRIPADRIVAGTYLFGCVATGGSIELAGAPWRQLGAVTELARRMGAECCVSGTGLHVRMNGRPQAVPRLRTAVYPGFPTDLQSAALAALTLADGNSRIEERIFENRFRVVGELQRLGADIQRINARTVLVSGTGRLHGARVEAAELRGGAALILAGLAAEGETIVSGCGYVARGYEDIIRDLRGLGAGIDETDQSVDPSGHSAGGAGAPGRSGSDCEKGIHG